MYTHKQRKHKDIDNTNERELNAINNAVFNDSEVGTSSNISDEKRTNCSDCSEFLLFKFILNLRFSSNTLHFKWLNK